MTEQHSPLQSLREGHWFKLICGASFQHLPAIRNLTLAYTLAGADCIDVAADPAVILAAKEALSVALRLETRVGENPVVHRRPLLMVSLNDGDDPHFRKATFIPADCPPECSRPCEAICPAQAIAPTGIMPDRCYGCGRCLPVCPVQHITTRTHVATPQAIAPLILEAGIDAIEIHTQPGHFDGFRRLWAAIAPVVHHLKLLAISCPDGDDLIAYLQRLYDLIAPLPCPLIWQTDGRPMSGDIGIGTTRATVKLGQKVLHANLPGYVQLAGGTNQHTVAKLRSLNLFRASAPLSGTANGTVSAPRHIAGIAYGSYARVLLMPVLEALHTEQPDWPPPAQGTNFKAHPFSRDGATGDRSLQPLPTIPLETNSTLLHQAVNLAQTLVVPLKHPDFTGCSCDEEKFMISPLNALP